MMRKPHRCAVAALAVAAWCSASCAENSKARGADRQPAAASSAAKGKVPSRQVELFQAMQSGELEVKLIPKDSKQATVVIKNTTDKRLEIRLPEAFAGVPVLAQVDGLGGGGRDRGGGGGSNINQSFGGGMGGMGMGMGMGGMRGGMFNVAPAKVRKIKVATVCLQHGKPDPNPRVPYALKPIESYTQDQKVIEVCKMLGQGKIHQHAAQAAAWHLTDRLSWPQLAAKVKVRHLNGSTELYFSPRDLQRAFQIVQVAAAQADKKAQGTSPAEIESDRYYRQTAAQEPGWATL
jgi:hypothetical protein